MSDPASAESAAMKTRPALIMGVAALCFALGLPSPASAQWTVQPTMVGDSEITVVQGGDSWINVVWTAPSELENFRMVVNEWSLGTEVSYAEGTDAAYLSQDADLAAGEMDTASFKLTTSARTPRTVWLQVIAEWEHEGQTYRYFPGGISVRMVQHDGEPYSLLTDSATVASSGDGSANWIELDFIGLAPVTGATEVRVNGDLPVYYPQETYTSLHHDDQLHAQENDVARVWIDPETVQPGSQTVELVVDFTDHFGRTQTKTHQLTVTVS